jgi:hypothetical protein
MVQAEHLRNVADFAACYPAYLTQIKPAVRGKPALRDINAA